jgi:nitroimidazol reductase NimA-like FMN-containing flavoprotein (pyridoxamine 5'-phosphate oxidase superfamily)
VSAAEARTKLALELTEHARTSLELIKEQQDALAKWEAAVVEGEAKLAAHEEEEVTRIQELQEREAAVEEELAAGTQRLQERGVALQERSPRWRRN